MSTVIEHLVVGLDVGTSHVTTVAGVVEADDMLTIIDGGRVQTAGVRQGVIVNMQEATATIERAIFEVEERTGRRVTAVCVGMSGRSLTSQNARGTYTITPLGREITSLDVQNAITAAQTHVVVDATSEILHEIPRAYMVDGQTGVQDPHGMAGVELDVEVHYVLGTSTVLQNLMKCVRDARVTAEMAVAAPLAAGEAVRGAHADAQCLAVINIGAETTTLAIYVNDSIWLSKVLPIGGADISRELGAQLKLPLSAAEQLKVQHGHCDPHAIEPYGLVDLPPSVGIDALVPRAEIVRIIHDGASLLGEELYHHFQQARAVGVEPEIVVLTGGGANLPGLDTLLMQMLEAPVALGVPTGMRNSLQLIEHPEYVTAAGLALWQARYALHDERRTIGKRLHDATKVFNGVKRLIHVVLP